MQSPHASSRPSPAASHEPIARITSRSPLLPVVAATAVLFALVASACGGGGSRYGSSSTTAPTAADASTSPSGAVQGASTSGTQLDVTEKDFGIALDEQSANRGNITFHVTNEGPTTHEFVVFKTDAAPGALPVNDNKVDEEAQEVTHIDEVEDIAMGESKDLSVSLDPGNYVLICNLPAHYGLGMRAALHVV
jgi:uncharacterized cupredoxin-like copper-binding protein